jgi:hypothetical protein
MFTVHLHIEFQTPSPNCSIFITVKLKAKDNFQMASMLFLSLAWKLYWQKFHIIPSSEPWIKQIHFAPTSQVRTSLISLLPFGKNYKVLAMNIHKISCLCSSESHHMELSWTSCNWCREDTTCLYFIELEWSSIA